jgi:hypothetical protein
MSRLSTLLTAGLTSSVLIAPLVLLELRYGTHNYSSFPYPVFAILWVLPPLFVFTIAPLIRPVRPGGSVLAHPMTLLLRVAVLALIGMLWTQLLTDQLPCFLGVPNCD